MGIYGLGWITAWLRPKRHEPRHAAVNARRKFKRLWWKQERRKAVKELGKDDQ